MNHLLHRLVPRTLTARLVVTAVALVAVDEGEWHRQREALVPLLRSGEPLPLSPTPGAFFRERPVGGQLAFVFGGPGSVYQGMGRSLVLALPELHEQANGPSLLVFLLVMSRRERAIP